MFLLQQICVDYGLFQMVWPSYHSPLFLPLPPNGPIHDHHLDTARFPTATFRSTRVVFEGDKPKSVDGQLTIKGITRPVTLNVTSFTTMPHPMLKKPTLGANAFTMIKRSDFNAAKFAPYVGDDVRIDIAVEAIAP